MPPRQTASSQQESGSEPTTGGLKITPAVASLAITAIFFVGLLVGLHPGYWINDDLKIIWNIVGYPGSPTFTPFMIYSNVLLGMLLAALYSLPTSVNWMVVLLSLVNACAVFSFIYLVASAAGPRSQKLMGIILVLAVSSLLVLNITYTVTAALAALAGFALMLAASGHDTAYQTGKLAAGVALIVIASLIRIQMLALALALVIPGVLALGGQRNWRRVIAATAIAGALVAAGYLFDKLYVRLVPEWNSYYTYNALAQKMHDSHRLDNVRNLGRRVSWTDNDQELFARWFYPDESLYSSDRLAYLVNHARGTSQDVWGTAITFLERLVQLPAAAYLVCMLGTGLWVIGARRPARQLWSLVLVWAAALASNSVLAWAYKDPDYVLFSGMAGSLALAAVLIAVAGDDSGIAAQPSGESGGRRARAVSQIILDAGVAMLIAQLVMASGVNAGKHAAYEGMLRDLGELQASGKIAADALIIAPAHGLPYEWSNPFLLSRPAVSYFDTGWLTFSPTYLRILAEFNIESLPQALYQDDNVYLMCEDTFTQYLATYYEEHLGKRVSFQAIYAMPNPNHLAGYDGNSLYKVSLAP